MPKQGLNYEGFADPPTATTYQSVPIADFGYRLLQKMGFCEEKGIGKKQYNPISSVVLPNVRPKGLGLGADISQQKKPQIEIGDFVQITNGIHSGLNGFIVLVEQGRASIQLEISQAVVRVANSDFTKRTKQTRVTTKTEEVNKGHNKLKWIKPNIKLKVIDRNSKFYLKKVVVTQILSNRQFECFQEKSQTLISTFKEKDVQTVVPKIGEKVIILKGIHKGKKGKVIQRGRQVMVQTQDEFLIIRLFENDLSEFVEF